MQVKDLRNETEEVVDASSVVDAVRAALQKVDDGIVVSCKTVAGKA